MADEHRKRHNRCGRDGELINNTHGGNNNTSLGQLIYAKGAIHVLRNAFFLAIGPLPIRSYR